MIDLLLGQVWPYLLAALALVGGLLGYGARQRARGRDDARRKAKEADYENAGDIRDRVERDLPDRLRAFDGAGWRD